MRSDGGLWVPGAVAASTPTSGNILYPKSDGMWYTKDSSGTEVLVGSENVPTPASSTSAANRGYVDAQVSSVSGSGQERGYAERRTNYSSTNSTLFSTDPSAVISGLSVTVTGNGRPHDIEFFTPGILHSTNVIVTTYLIVNGSSSDSNTQFQNWATSFGQGGSMRQRLVLANGVDYTFTVGVAGATAGTISVSGSTVGQMYLSVVQR